MGWSIDGSPGTSIAPPPTTTTRKYDYNAHSLSPLPTKQCGICMKYCEEYSPSMKNLGLFYQREETEKALFSHALLRPSCWPSICLSTRTAVHSHIHQSILQSDSQINHLSVNASIRPCLLVEFFPFLFHVIVLIPPSLRSFPPLYSVADPEGEEIRSWTLIQLGCRF